MGQGTTVPRCSKCGRVLTDPTSIAIGVGPECRGDSGRSRSKRLHTRRARGQACAQERLNALQNHLPVVLSETNVYEPVDGGYRRKDGRVISVEAFEAWLRQYGLIASRVTQTEVKQ